MSHLAPGERADALPGHHCLLDGLTPEQARAVTHGPGPLLLLAGPGAGKTRTLTHRIAYLLRSGQANPREILAVTFSVRAAGELRLRLADLLGEQQARDDALNLVRLLLGRSEAPNASEPRWTCPIAGGQRTVTLTLAPNGAEPAAGG